MEPKVSIVIDQPRMRAIYWNGEFLDTNQEIQVSISDAIRLSRLYSVKFQTPFTPYNPQHWKEKRFGFIGDADTVSGFGNCTVNLIKYSLEEGYDIRWSGRTVNFNEFGFLARKQIPLDIGMVWHDQPRDEWATSPFQKNIAIVPFETTRIPKSWISKINSFDALLVPCEQNIEMMKSSGVRIPIELIHWGVDEKKFQPLERHNTVFTFGTMGALSTRKGTDLLVHAFVQAFPPDIKDVKFICKTSSTIYPFMMKDKRIEVQMTPVGNDELIENFMRKIDCFVFPTRGEGFGLTPLEAMATGVPAIVTGWSGPNEYMREDIGWKIDYTMEPAKNFTEQVYKEDCGDWALPSIDHLVQLLRYAYEHQDEVKQKGKRAAEYVQQEWLWKDKIKMFHAALDKHL